MSSTQQISSFRSRMHTHRWVFGCAAILVVLLGTWALRLQAAQARDTIRKHDIEDLERALVRLGKTDGTYPPIEAGTWCGTLSDPRNAALRETIERSLRKSEKYEKPEKPFPTDPVFHGTARDYFYWKESPTSFELLAELEADPNDTKDTSPCGGTVLYDYGIRSIDRHSF